MNADDAFGEIDYLERTMQGKAPPHLSPAGTCGRLAELYLLHTQLPASAEKALIYVRAGLEQVDIAGPFFPKLKHFEAMALRRLPVAEDGTLGVAGTAAQSDRAAIERCYAAMPQDALVFASQWGNWAWEQRAWAEAGEAFSYAARCLNKLLREQIEGDATRLEMAQQLSCVTRGAYAFCEDGRYADAVLLLERANHFFYSVHEDARALQTLRIVAPELVAELLDVLTPRVPYDRRFDHLGQLQPEERTRLDRKDALVRQVRSFSGYEEFAMIPDWATVQAVARDRPLLYLFTCDYGLKAILIGEDRMNSLHCITVASDLTTAALRDLLMPFLRAEFERSGAIAESSIALSALLERVTATIGGTVLSALTALGFEETPVACIPIGLTALVPLHVQLQQIGYAYSARSLRRCLQHASDATIDRALVIDNPRPLPAAYDPLLLSAAEAAVVVSRFPTTVLSGVDATETAVVNELSQAALLHFSCHGTIDRRFGYASVLLLANRELLTIRRLRAITSLRARLVVLSACATGVLALSTEQTLTLPFHFLGAGAGGVLATMWHSDETATLAFVQLFYAAWTVAVTPAEALQIARTRLAGATAAELRTQLSGIAHSEAALRALAAHAPDAVPFAHPWYWGTFFIAGA